jgi:uncharacterized protein (DUF2147 family)
MNKVPHLLILSIMLIAGHGSSAIAAEPFGTWVRPSTGAHVNFYECGGKLCAKIVSVKDSSHASLVGTEIVKNASEVSGGIWKGDLFDPESGKTYAGTITVEGSKLKLEGCVMAILCSDEYWTKAGN